MVEKMGLAASKASTQAGVETTTKLQHLPGAALRRAADDAISVGDQVSHNAVRSRLFGGTPEPTRIGRFVILRKIGAGGMGVVYSAYDEELDRKVAIKLLHAERQGSEGRARILREAQALARISHPNIVHVYEVGEWKGQVFMAMEFVQGETLDEHVHKERSWRKVLAAYIAAGEGLAAAHETGLVHRDVKPENLLIDTHGRVKILDFGLARFRAAEVEATTLEDEPGLLGSTANPTDRHKPTSPDDHSNPSTAVEFRRTLTAAGVIVGTPAYMSPEQCSGLPVTARSDIFSYCVALYEGLYGERPFSGATLPNLITAICNGEINDPPRGTKVPHWLRRTLIRGLAVRPDDRWPSMRELLAALRIDPPRRRRTLLYLAGPAALAMGLVAAALPAKNDEACRSAAARLDGIWDAATKATIREVVAGSDLTYAAATWQLTESRLDSYATDWTETFASICIAHQQGETSDELYDRQIACLEGHRVEFEAVSGVLAEADAMAIPRFNDIVRRLPPLASCRDTDALRESYAPPSGQQQIQAVETIRRRLVELRAKLHAGYIVEVAQDVKGLVRSARETGYKPLLAEALFDLGEVRYHQMSYSASEEAYQEAFLTADGVRHDELAARAGGRLVFVVGYHLARADEARVRTQHVRAVLDRLGRAHIAEAELENALGAIAQGLANYAEAREHYERGLAIVDGLSLDRSPHVHPILLSNLSEACEDLGDTACTEQSTSRALQIIQDENGDEHPSIAHYIGRMASVRVSQGRTDDAQALTEKMIRLTRKNFGENHFHHRMAVWKAGSTLLWAGRLGQAAAHLDRAEELSETATDQRLDRPWMLMFRSELEERRNNQGAALESSATALATLTERDDVDPSSLRHARNRHSKMLALAGRHAESEPLAALVLEEVERIYNRDHPEVAMPLTNLARNKIASGELDVAAAHLARARHVLEERAPEHWRLLDPLELSAQLALDLEEPEAAIEAAQSGLRILRKHGCMPFKKAQFGLLLARARAAAGASQAEVLATIQRALTDAEAIEGTRVVQDEIDAWLATYCTATGGCPPPTPAGPSSPLLGGSAPLEQLGP